MTGSSSSSSLPSPRATASPSVGAEFGRRRYTAGTVVRLDGSHIVVTCRGPGGGPFIERYGRRDGVRVGGLTRDQLVSPDTGNAAATTEERWPVQRIDALYREWARNRTDVDSLRRLHAAITEVVEESLAGTQ